MTTTDKNDVRGTLWLGDAEDPADGPTVFEGADALFAVERTDEDEVALHVTLPGDSNALASLYMTPQEAVWIGRLLDAAALA